MGRRQGRQPLNIYVLIYDYDCDKLCTQGALAKATLTLGTASGSVPVYIRANPACLKCKSGMTRAIYL
jgi:hypothetical protein